MKIIRLALRSIVHFRLYTLINILGLALSLTCIIVIFRYVYGEFTADHFNKKLDRIYAITVEHREQPGEISFGGVYNPNNEKTFKDIRQHPGVEESTDYVLFENEDIELGEQQYTAAVLAVDSNFTKILDIPIMTGNAKFSDPKSALITDKFAKKVFGSQDPVGKTIRYSNGEILTITGVIKELPYKSTLSFDLIISYHLSRFWSRMPKTLILLYPEMDYKAVNKDYSEFVEMSVWKIHKRNQLYPYKDVYFNKQNIYTYDFNHGNYTYTLILMTVGFLIFLIGIINFVNIYTVIMLRRGREFGMKKVFGAEGRAIFIQLMAENMLMIAFAVVLATIFSEMVNPFLKNNLNITQVSSSGFNLLLFGSLLFILPLIVSIYPFLRYNYSKPITSIKNVVTVGRFTLSRRIFLVLQYVVTIVMIILSLFFIKQLNYMLSADLGYRTENIIKTQFLKRSSDYLIRSSDEERERKRKKEENIETLVKQKMDASPLFSYWTYGDSPGLHGGTYRFKVPEGEFKNVTLIGADETWMKLFEIELTQGRLWDNKTEDEFNYNLIVSESALKEFGIKDFNTSELQSERRIWFTSGREEEMKTNPPYKIVGVIKDFYVDHLSKKANPVVFYYSQGWREEPLIASVVPGRKQDAIEFLNELYDETVGGEFSFSFVEDEVHAMYEEDKKVATIYSIFTVIAILVSSLGLFSMSLFDVQCRYREIAIRKVNGASCYTIVGMLLKRYFILLSASFGVAVPIALYAINRYLEEFAHKAPVSWWLFVVAFIITATISLLTLIYQTRRAANQNPAKVLKSE